MRPVTPAALLFLSALLPAVVLDPIVDTDRSVCTYSARTIVTDLIRPGMADTTKLKVLFSFHRRMMHHYRLEQNTEDNISTFDIIKLYTVYGSSWCSQQAVVFRALCSEVFGSSNTLAPSSSGLLSTYGRNGGHTSFQLRFNASDSWHWVDPIIGAYALTRDKSRIAGLDDILADPGILTEAVAEGRASTPYFPCATPPKSAPQSLEAAYAYYDYDTAFVRTFRANPGYSRETSWARQSPFFTTKKNLKKGEAFIFLWDHFPGGYHNLQDKTYAHDVNGILTRDWAWYPPRHLCGWKDSLDTINWPYFKPYKKVINGDTCTRYFANGIQRYAPDLTSADPRDTTTVSIVNMAFQTDDGLRPALRPAAVDSAAQIAWRFRSPYPYMSLAVSGNYVRRHEDDTLELLVTRLYFDNHSAYSPGYLDTLTAKPETLVTRFAVSDSGNFLLDLRRLVDPVNQSMYRTFYGVILKFRMKARGHTGDVGLNSLRADLIFQHSMFALPQLEPGPNKVRISAATRDFTGENLKVGFGWRDQDTDRNDIHAVTAVPDSYNITVNQTEIPRMLWMAVANGPDSLFADRLPVTAERPRPGRTPSRAGLTADPNPFNPRVRLSFNDPALSGSALPDITIFDARGRKVETLVWDAAARNAAWDASGRPAGLYFAVLRKSGLVRTCPLVYVR